LLPGSNGQVHKTAALIVPDRARHKVAAGQCPAAVFSISDFCELGASEESEARRGTISSSAGLRGSSAPGPRWKRAVVGSPNLNQENVMKRIGPYFAATTLGIALLASSPAAAWHCHRFYSGYYGTTYPYGWSAPYRYSAWNNWSYPYNYSAWNYGWGAPAAGLGSLAAAPFEVAGAAVAAPVTVAANTGASLITGRSVAVEPIAGTRISGPRIRHVNMRHMSSRHVVTRHMISRHASMATGRMISRHASMATGRMSGEGMRATTRSY
jgi:hypothetical protein